MFILSNDYHPINQSEMISMISSQNFVKTQRNDGCEVIWGDFLSAT